MNISNLKFKVFSSKAEVISKLVDFIFCIHSNNQTRNYVFPGGVTPVALYKELARRNIDWFNTKVILSDERIVTPGDNMSNEKMIRTYFINEIKGCKSKPIIVNLRDENILNELRPEITILGIGVDGHIASLFPGEKRINSFSSQNILYGIKKNGEDFCRISLTFNYLCKSKYLIFLVFGKEKENIIRKVIRGPYNPEQLPVQYLINKYEGDIMIYCDSEAYGNLNE